MKIKISREAQKDLNNIWVYTKNKWSKIQADRYYSLLIQEIDFISKNHLVGESISEIRVDYRFTKVKSHLIFYRTPNKEIIEIVRILHQRMDVKSRLK